MLAEESEDARDALTIVRERVKPAQILVPPTAVAELLFQSENESDYKQRELAKVALLNLRAEWKFHPATLNTADEARMLAAARRLLFKGVLPRQEWNDAKIVSESATLNSTLLVSNDSHLLEVDHRWLVIIFREFDLPVPLIASPRDLIHKFYRR
jgi:hypothetical protein